MSTSSVKNAFHDHTGLVEGVLVVLTRLPVRGGGGRCQKQHMYVIVSTYETLEVAG